MSNKTWIQQLVLQIPGLFHCLVLYFWFRLIKSRGTVKNEGDLKRILIVKLDAIGDFILWLDVAKELRNIYPQNEYVITLLGNRQWTNLAKSLTCFDEVLEIDRVSFFAHPANYSELLKKLCRVTFDVVLHPVYSREFLFGDLFVCASDAKQKIGMQGDSSNLSWWQKRLGDCCYSDLVSGLSELGSELEHNAQLLHWLGLVDFKAGVPDLEGRYEMPFMQLPTDYYVIIPGASVSLRRWPISSFIELIERVHALTGIAAVVCGSRAEEDLGRIIEMGTSTPLVNLVGKTSLNELVAVVSEAHIVVANETSGVHIAAALGIPAVCIVGGGHFGRFIPYSSDIISSKQLPVPVFEFMECFGCNWKCIHKIPLGEVAPCIEKVSSESVVSVVLALVGKQIDERTEIT